MRRKNKLFAVIMRRIICIFTAKLKIAYGLKKYLQLQDFLKLLQQFSGYFQEFEFAYSLVEAGIDKPEL